MRQNPKNQPGSSAGQPGPEYWDTFFQSLRSTLKKGQLPSVSQIAAERPNPFRVLVSTMISLRTKDEVTRTSSNRLFAEADTPATMRALTEDRIAQLIYPAGFYRTKATHILQVAQILGSEHNDSVPSNIEQLTALPGVGRKTANLVLNLGFGLPAICVDTHVHRISNRFGWVTSKTPDQTEIALTRILPENHWIEINELLVLFGQQICTPVSPKCSTCLFREGHPRCKRVGVEKSR